jgi:hypothetical protein
MRGKRLATVGLFSAIALAGGVVPAGAANAGQATARPDSFTCGFDADGVRIHKDHSTSSTVLGLAYRSHSCRGYSEWYTPQGGGWVNLTDLTTGVTGWVAWTYVDY